jgi:hypothetical protein
MNGKGSRSRVRNYDSYRDNYDLIFKNKEEEIEQEVESNDKADQEDSASS